MKIVVDIDGTVVDSVSPWINQLVRPDQVSGLMMVGGTLNHELVALTGKTYADVTQYWKDIDYTKLPLIDGCLETLRTLHKQGNEIFFLTSCLREHIQSKFDFVDMHFPFASDLMISSRKDLVKADCMVEDNLTVLSSMKDVEIPVIFTGVSGRFQPELKTYGGHKIDRWVDLLNVLGV